LRFVMAAGSPSALIAVLLAEDPCRLHEYSCEPPYRLLTLCAGQAADIDRLERYGYLVRVPH